MTRPSKSQSAAQAGCPRRVQRTNAALECRPTAPSIAQRIASWAHCEAILRTPYGRTTSPLFGNGQLRLQAVTLLRPPSKPHNPLRSPTNRIRRTLERRVRQVAGSERSRARTSSSPEPDAGYMASPSFTCADGRDDRRPAVPAPALSLRPWSTAAGTRLASFLGGESFTRWPRTCKQALWSLVWRAAKPPTDSLSAAFRNLTTDQRRGHHQSAICPSSANYAAMDGQPQPPW